MKKLILIALITVALAGCEKDTETQKLAADTEPSVTGVTFFPSTVNSISHVGMKISVSIPEKGSVKELVLVRVSPLQTSVAVKLPETGTYTTYDNIAQYPQGSQTLFYYFILKKTDNTEVVSKEFQVL